LTGGRYGVRLEGSLGRADRDAAAGSDRSDAMEGSGPWVRERIDNSGLGSAKHGRPVAESVEGITSFASARQYTGPNVKIPNEHEGVRSIELFNSWRV
jgi:hypothetical protein